MEIEKLGLFLTQAPGRRSVALPAIQNEAWRTEAVPGRVLLETGDSLLAESGNFLVME